MTSEESLKEFVKQRLTAAAQQIFSIFQQNLDQCQDEMQRQRQLLDVILKPERRPNGAELPHKSGFVEEWKSCLEQRTLCIRQEGGLLAGSHCNVGEEFVKQRICAAADDLWSLLESVFTGQQADRDGRDPGGLRPMTEPPLLPVCKEEEEERSCSLTPHTKEEQLDFCSTQDVEQLVLKQQQEEEEEEEGTPSDGDRGQRLAGSHCNVGEEFVKQRICAAADDLWSLLESVFTGQQADRDGRDPGGLRPTTEPPLLPVCKEEEEERSCSLTPHTKEEQLDFCSTQDVEQLVLKQQQQEEEEEGTHRHSQNRFVDEELTAAVDDIFSVIERFLCTSTWEHQHPLLDVVRSSHQRRTERSQQQKSRLDRENTEALWIKEEEVEREEQLLLKQDKAQNVDLTEASLSENSPGFGSCGQTGSDVAVDQGTKSRPPAPKTKKTFKCETCGKTSQRRYLHLQHVRTHTGEKPYTCETCGNCFNQKSALNQHMRIHTGEKPFLCKTCGRTFGQASSLRAHRIIHTDEKPHECRFCGMTFALLERLIRHTRVHTDERPYACQVCGRSFRQSTSLSVHLRVHSGERPYQCGFCGKGFVDKSGVNAHQKIHLGEKPHRCRTCGKFFRNTNQLKIHTRIHTGEKPFTCRSCGRRFNQLASFQKHLETHGDHMTRDDWTFVEEDSPSFIPEDA
ncbi:putative zinc finger protein 286B [Cynoglossus semilaevis]|uniref:putative zinc finger protein 286B n=1 Tax=Cynoglossus semilaevis TaxID=244447 RepID=UPI000D62B39C|nr:putative zinc finger protein 286B [Cynoglossus semilaevis]